MIDEDLYQQAADELNTDKRRPHIWARACALASDDHDEARYLYTNLRVEELIAEREAAGADSSDDNHANSDKNDELLTLEPLDVDDDRPASISTPSGFDQNEDPDLGVLTLNSAASDELPEAEQARSRNFQENFNVRTGDDSDLSSDSHPEANSDGNSDYSDQESLDELSLHDDFLDDTINLTSELDGTAVFELDNADASDIDDTDIAAVIGPGTDADADIGADNDEHQADDLTRVSAEEELEALLGGVYEAGAPVEAHDGDEAMTADFSDVSGSHDLLADDDLEWLDSDLGIDDSASDSTADGTADNQLQTVPPVANDSLTLADFEDTDRLAQELERQADELPGQTSDVVAVSDSGHAAPELSLDDSSAAPGGSTHESPTEDELEASVNDLLGADDDANLIANDTDDASASQAADPSAGTEQDEYGLDSIFNSIENDAEEQITPPSDTRTEGAATSISPEPDISLEGSDTASESAFAPDEEPPAVEGSAEHDRVAATDRVEGDLPVAAMAALAGGGAASAMSGNSVTAGRDERASDHANEHPSAAIGAGSRPGNSAARSELPIDLTSERNSGTRYTVLKRDSQMQAVKNGGSWSALFLTLPFLIYRHLFGTAVVYTLMWLILLTGLLVSGLAWLDAGPTASMIVKASTFGFSLLSIIGLLYLPFRYANQWREQKLEQRGFEPVAMVRDSSPGKAISQARNAGSFD